MLQLDGNRMAELLAWCLLGLVLLSTLTLALLSARERSRWLAAGTASGLLITIIIAALWSIPVPPVAAVLLTLMLGVIGVVGGSGAARLALELAGGSPEQEGEHGGILVPTDPENADVLTTTGAADAAAGAPVTDVGPEDERSAATAPAPEGFDALVAGPVAAAPTPTREVLRGGTTIGVLERLALIGAILTGYPEAIAAIIAIKGVGRFGELDSPASRERFIIGSFASLIWAAAAASALAFLL